MTNHPPEVNWELLTNWGELDGEHEELEDTWEPEYELSETLRSDDEALD